MSRRACVGAAAALTAQPGNFEFTDKLQMVGQQNKTELAGLTLTALRQRYHDELFNIVVPFWDKHGIDHEYGGFMCALDHDGTRVNTDKFLWFQGRGLWVYSYLYQHFGKDRRHLEIARKTKDFAINHLRQADGAWAQMVARAGRVIQPPKPDPSGLLYMAEGLQEYARASGDEESWKLALSLLKAQFRAITRPRAVSETPPQRKQGFWFLSLVVATQMLRQERDPEIAEIAERAVETIIKHHYNPATGLNTETLNYDFTRPQDAATLTIIGHSIEALWMVMAEALRRKDQKLADVCAERLRHHLEVGWDRVYGGLVHAVNVNQGNYQWPVERPVGTGLEFRFDGEYHYMKTLWSLDEVLLATLMVLERQRAEWAARYFTLAQEFIDTRLALKKHGYPLHLLFTDRQATFQLHASRQENYHHFRTLMFNLLALERMMQRQPGR